MNMATIVLLIFGVIGILGLGGNGALSIALISFLPSVVCLLPLAVHQPRKVFLIYNPLVYATIFFFGTQVITPAMTLMFAPDSPALMPWLLWDPVPQIRAAIVMSLIAALGLVAGYLSPIGRFLARKFLRNTFSGANVDSELVVLILLVSGLALQMLAFTIGAYGFNLHVGVFGATVFAFARIKDIATVAWWMCIFRRQKFSLWRILLGLMPLALDIAVGGNKGAMFNWFVLMLAAHQFVRRVYIRRVLSWVLVSICVVIVGFVYGTEWRTVKTAEYGRASVISLSSTAGVHMTAVNNLLSRPLAESLRHPMELVGVRASGVTSLGVILARKTELESMERMIGIDETIFQYAVLSFVPRFLWREKPVLDLLEQVGRLYFGTYQTSPALTVMGDLYRHGRTVAVLLGMATIGIFLRTSYEWMLLKPERIPLRSGIYVSFLLLINWEASFSGIFPALLRHIFVVFLVSVFIRLFLVHARKEGTTHD